MRFRVLSLSFLLISIAFSHNFVFAQKCVPEEPARSWAESTLKSLSLDQKIAQLLMIRVHSDWSQKELNNVYSQVKKYGVGGVCFFSGSPTKELLITNRLQNISAVPLLVSIDGEWGPSMRLDSCAIFPHQFTLGALPDIDDELIFDFGREVALQCHALGIHINFAPCIDVNNNSQNPVINSRSFGESREQVARKGSAYMFGMQSEGLSACAKHFPGHGDTKVDSHFDLPVINKSRAELDSLELFPYRELIHNGVDMVMVSHLNVPALNDTSFSIATLSKKVISDLLRGELGFNGIVITDGMDMKGVRNAYPQPGDAELMSLMAGTDILLLPGDLAKVIQTIKSAVLAGNITEDFIDQKCLRVLEMKYAKGLNHFKPLKKDNLISTLNSPHAESLIDKMQEDALTLLRNRNNLLPLAKDSSTVLLCVGSLSDSNFLHTLADNYHIGYVHISKTIDKKNFDQVKDKLSAYKNVIIAVLQTSQYLKNSYGIAPETTQFLSTLAADKHYALALLGNPYGLEKLGNLDGFDAVSVGYQYNRSTVKSMLSALMGEIDFQGHLPVSTAGFSAQTEVHLYEKYKEANTYTSSLSDVANAQIDSLVNDAIQQRIFPGCQVLAMKDDEIIYAKNFGYLTYEDSLRVNDETMYDVASMTKALATTLAMMKLYDNEAFQINDKVSEYLTYLKGTDKEKITIAELMTHTSGLPAFIPFYREIATKGIWDAAYLKRSKSEQFSLPVADSVFLRSDFPDLVRKRIARCKLGDKKYVYSDLNFILLKDIVEALSGQALDEFVMQNFYLPMGLHHTCFNPLNYVSKANIAPTENDDYFRNQQIQGYVHDQSAAVLGGVGGNAGLFSTAHEVAALLSMLMNGGEWRGVQYLSEKTVHQFITTHPLHNCARRSLGFDTPSFAKKSTVLPSLAKKHTFGHQGFTGTVFWCDPDNGLIYVFLSNRVYPNTEPNNLSKSRLRVLLHEVIYNDLVD